MPRYIGAVTNLLLGKKEGKTLYEKWKANNETKIDENLPLGIRVGGMLEIDIPQSSLVLCRGDIVMKKPPKRGIIFSIGIEPLESDLKIIRVYYSKSVDEPDDVSEVAFLQVELKGKTILETKVFTLDNEFDLTEDDSDSVFDNGDGTFTASIPFWLSGDQPILGGPEFQIPKGEDDLWAFTRVSKPNLSQQVTEERIETLYSSSFEKSGVPMKLTLAEYHRLFKNPKAFSGREYCTIRLNETPENASIEVYLGVSVEKSKITAY